MFSRLNLRGARVLLTGASSGIGWALALRLAEQGARLVLASRNQERLETLAGTIRAQGGEAVVVPTDVADAGQRVRLVEATRAALGGLDVLINNAGVGSMAFFAGSSEERLRQIMEVNFFAATELTRLVLPDLRQGRDALIVNVASVLGRRAIPGCNEYCASKFALVGWSESLRAELAGQRIHVLVVCPGAVATGFRANLIEDRVRLPFQNRFPMTADRCARLIVRAMRRRRNEVVITSGAKMLIWLNRLAPWLVDRLMARFAPKP